MSTFIYFFFFFFFNMVVVPNAEWLVLASRCILNKKVPFNFSMKDLVIMLCIGDARI
jgi:hypothetical protein